MEPRTETTVIPGSVPGRGERLLAAWGRSGALETFGDELRATTMTAAQAVEKAIAGMSLVMPDVAAFDRVLTHVADTPLEPAARVLRLQASLPGANRAVAASRAVASRHPALETLEATAQCRALSISPDPDVPDRYRRVLLVADMMRAADEGQFTGAQGAYAEEIADMCDAMMSHARDPYWVFSAAEKVASMWEAMRTADPGYRARAQRDGTVVEATVLKGGPSRLVAACPRPPRVRAGKRLVVLTGRGWPARSTIETTLAASKTTRAGFEIVLSGKNLPFAAGQVLVLMEAPFIGREGARKSKWSRPAEAASTARTVPAWLGKER